ncbi:AAA family ATPase [Rhodococcus hoagii]|nr:AAA family ATPase [Prescottella equi]
MRAKVDCVGICRAVRRPRTTRRATPRSPNSTSIAARCRLVLVGGLPATGKSTVAARLAETVGAELISSDHVRRHLFAADRTATPDPGYRSGRYSPDSLHRPRLRLDARPGPRVARRGRSVVLDASWTHRDTDCAPPRRRGVVCADLVQLQCTAPAELTEHRLRERAASRRDHDSEADARGGGRDGPRRRLLARRHTGRHLRTARCVALRRRGGMDRAPG